MPIKQVRSENSDTTTYSQKHYPTEGSRSASNYSNAYRTRSITSTRFGTLNTERFPQLYESRLATPFTNETCTSVLLLELIFILHIFTRNQLQRLHRHMLHPSSRKRYDLLRRAAPANLPLNTLNTIKEISKACETCPCMPLKITFRIRDADKITFNHRILTHIMFVNCRRQKSRPVLHNIDAGPRFSAEAF